MVCPKRDVFVNCKGIPTHILEGKGVGSKLAVGRFPIVTKPVPEGWGVVVQGFCVITTGWKVFV